MWDLLPPDLQNKILSMTPAVEMRDCDVVYADQVDEDDIEVVQEFAQEQKMFSVHGVMCGNECACTLPSHIHIDRISQHTAQHRSSEWEPSWNEHFELDLARTSDGRIWAYNGSSEYSPIGRYEKRTFYRYPKACRLTRRYAERIGTTRFVLYRCTCIQDEVDATGEIGLPYIPAVVMHVRQSPETRVSTTTATRLHNGFKYGLYLES
jgi:hypothetical protein